MWSFQATRAQLNSEIGIYYRRAEIILSMTSLSFSGLRWPALYKFRQASSSSSLNQSFLREDSLATEMSNLSLIFLVLSNRTNSKTASSDASGTCSISFRISSFLLINHLVSHQN